MPALLTAKQAAEYIGSTVGTLSQDRYMKRGLPYVTIGHRVRYRATDIVDYLDSRVVQPKDNLAPEAPGA